jgi:tetratricopeptide (TPR) repeat protein
MFMGSPKVSAIAPRYPFLLVPLALCLLLPPVALLVPSAIAAPPAQTSLSRQEKAQLHEKANRLAMLAVSLSKSSLPATSSAFYEEALQIFQKIGDYATAADLLQAMGGTARQDGQLQEAAAAYQRALAIYQGRNLSPIDRYRKSSEASEVLIILGEIYQAAGQFDRAQDAYQRALALGKLKDRYGGEAIAFNKLGTLYRLMNKPEQALAAYQKALALYEEVGGAQSSGDALSISRTV